ncbi:HNH endonuclease [Escherichia coli]|nr:HNH endonuclease [Escherichia coli]
MKCDLNHDTVLQLIHYNTDTGEFRRKNGNACGTKTSSGYIHIRLLGKKRLAHRLAWFYVYGEWPEHEIDHINGVKDDNRICNLRKATRSQNEWNKPQPSSNKSGAKGVRFVQKRMKWRADCMRKTLGYFKTKEQAINALIEYRNKIQGEFQNHGHLYTADDFNQAAAERDYGL